MVAGTVDLLRRRGVTATSLREVVRHTRTPRGSISHHFPDGKAQLLEEAVVYSRQHVSRALASALEEHGAVGGLRIFMDQWLTMLEATRFEAGCPVMAVAIEIETDATDGSPDAQKRLLAHADGAFEEWAGLLASALRREGVSRTQARALSVLTIAAFEGGIGLCRASRSRRPLEEVSKQLESAVGAALPPSRRRHESGVTRRARRRR
jgi:AcrR family transcriptional regulator